MVLFIFERINCFCMKFDGDCLRNCNETTYCIMKWRRHLAYFFLCR